jgi:hypothetical protein
MAKEKSYNIVLLAHSSSERVLHMGALGVLFLGILFFGSVFEVSYPRRLVELYAFPWWRLLLVCFVAISTWWCPRIGLLVAVATFFYLNDMHMLTTPFIGKK